MPHDLLQYDSLRTEWSAFFGLLSNDRGVRLRLNLPDTLVLDRGQPQAWLATNKDGYVVQRSAVRATADDVRQHFLSCAADGSSREYVAIMRLKDGLPKLLSRPAFAAVCDSLAEQIETGAASDGELPCVLQAYMPPFLDLRYVTSYTNDGTNISCHTFQRRFSRRYLQYHHPCPAPPAPGMLSASQVLQPQPSPSISSGAAAAGQIVGGEGAGSGNGSSAAAATECPEGALDDGALADSERSLARTLGPVDPSLKMLMRKAAHGLVQYVQKAHLLTLRGLVCEFMRDAEGHVWFLGPLRTDWASLIPGRGGEPWANANLTQQALDEDSWPPSVNDEVDLELQHYQSSAVAAVKSSAVHSGGGVAGFQQQPAVARSVCLSSTLDHQCISPHVQQTGSGSVSLPAAEGSSRPIDTAALLPPPAMPPAQHAQLLASPSVSGTHPPSGNSVLPGLNSSSPAAKHGVSAAAGDAALSSPRQQLALKVALRCSPGQKERSPGGSLGGGAKKHMQHGSSPTPGAGGGYRDSGHWGIAAYSLPRGSMSLTSHLTKELVSLKDELLEKTELADALASKVEDLEHDKHVITNAFERVLEGMQGDLGDVKARLEALRLERDRLACRLAEVEQKLANAESEREQLSNALQAERGTTLTSLGQFQKQQEDASVRAARAEAELRLLQERLKEEQMASDALKKQMVFYQHAMTSAGLGDLCPIDGGRDKGLGPASVLRGQERPEIKYAETLQAVEDLLMREADPTGERYSLSKVLHTCQGDLHAIFLHYCMLDAGFVRHWPPQLTLPGWLAFMKEIGSTNLVPGTRSRSDNTMHVQEAVDVFRRCCLRQAVMKGSVPLRLSSMRDSASPGAVDVPARCPSSQSTASGMPGSRPFTASSAQLAGVNMSYQSFCAALVHVAAKATRSSGELLEACPFLSEQTRAFVEWMVPKAQRVSPTSPSSKKAAGAAGPKPPGGMGDKEAAAKLPKLKKVKNKAGKAGADATAGEMSAIQEASREGSSMPGASPGSAVGTG